MLDGRVGIMMGRRPLLLVAAGGVAALIGSRLIGSPSTEAASGFEIKNSDAEWRKLLTQKQYYVLREHGTERAESSPLDHEKRKGIFQCVGCNLPLFSSETKFDSGTGWPSFYQPLPNAVGTSEDRSFLILQTEVHCRRCGGHLGHVYNDGPKPTGLRYCMNGIALKFIPAGTT